MIQDIITSPIQNIITSPFGGLLPPSENLKLWTRFNQGITETGLGVSQWDDQSGESNHIKQATDLDRPQKQADGSILFDGIRQFLKADAFTLVQPETVYILFKQIAWTANDYIYDGNTAASMVLIQRTTTPDLAAYAGSFSTNSSDLSLGAYGIASTVFNGASSIFQIDDNTEITGDFGANNAGGFTLGANGIASAGFSNMQVKEVLIYSAAHDAATRAKVIAYLQSI